MVDDNEDGVVMPMVIMITVLFMYNMYNIHLYSRMICARQLGTLENSNTYIDLYAWAIFMSSSPLPLEF